MESSAADINVEDMSREEAALMRMELDAVRRLAHHLPSLPTFYGPGLEAVFYNLQSLSVGLVATAYATNGVCVPQFERRRRALELLTEFLNKLENRSLSLPQDAEHDSGAEAAWDCIALKHLSIYFEDWFSARGLEGFAKALDQTCAWFLRVIQYDVIRPPICAGRFAQLRLDGWAYRVLSREFRLDIVDSLADVTAKQPTEVLAATS